MKRIRIADMNKSVTFHSPIETPDGHGGTEDGWNEEFSSLANFHPLRGSEISLAGRLVGKKPIIVTIPSSPDHVWIKTDWKMVCAGIEYNIRETPNETPDYNFFQFLVEGGVAVGV